MVKAGDLNPDSIEENKKELFSAIQKNKVLVARHKDVFITVIGCSLEIGLKMDKEQLAQFINDVTEEFEKMRP